MPSPLKFLRGQFYLRGRNRELRQKSTLRALRHALSLETLEWYVADSTGILMRKYPSDNLRYLLESGSNSDATPLIHRLAVERGGIAFDVGANRGQVSVALARNFRHVYCFEPDDRNLRELVQTLKVNGIVNASVSQRAVSATTGTALMRVSSDYGHHTLETTHISGKVGEIQVETVSLDDFANANAIETIDLLKVDVEGHEIDVLKGARELLARRAIRMIVFEHSPALFAALAQPADGVGRLLEGHGYKLSLLRGEPVSSKDLPNFPHADLIAVPK